jgi:acetyl-CoA carboxylase biotin carboxyl carrier protein
MPREQVTEIVAEMVANVMTVSVAAGDRVEPGDTVVLLRAVKVGPGDVVQEGDVLVELTL